MKPLNELGISPAPWRMSTTVGDVENTITENFETHDNAICSCWGTMQDMAADARLIAAAPELYEALRKLLIVAKNRMPSQPTVGEAEVMVEAEAALAEASGESEAAK